MRLILYIIILFPLLFIGQNNTTLKIQEDSLERLGLELRAQQIEIQRLKDEVFSLNKSLIEIFSKEGAEEEKPPHY